MVTISKPGKTTTDLFWNASSGVVKFNEGQCRMCERKRQVRPLTRHHLVPMRWFLGPGARFRMVRNANANIIPLCRLCHDQIEERDPIARRMLRKLLTQQEVAFAVRLRGIEWLNREYPFDAKRVRVESEQERDQDDHRNEMDRGEAHRLTCAPGK